MEDFKETLAFLEKELRAGRLKSVKERLEKLRYKKIPRAHLAQIANISRRVGHHRFALNMLNPVVRPQKPIYPATTNEELIEYSVNLMRIGVINEAYKILDSIKNQSIAEIYFNKALCLFNKWDYENAIPLLHRHLECNITPYQRLVTLLNLASAYVIESEFKLAAKILKQIFESANTTEQGLLVGYAHQTFAELAIHQRDIKSARKHLDLAQELLKDAHYRYALYNQQMRVVADLLEDSSSRNARLALKKVKETATTKKVWEVYRDCILYEAVLTQNSNLLYQIYFGTPLPAFRARALRLFNKKIVIPETYIFGSKQRNFDVPSGVDNVSGAALKKGQLSHRLLQLLASDFFRPFKTEAIFSHLFPDEYFDLTSSAHKVYDLIGRLRSWFKENKIPLEITNPSRNEFRLLIKENYGIKQTLSHKLADPTDHFIAKLKSDFAKNWFTCRQVMISTNLSRASAKRYLKKAVDRAALSVSGTGSERKYQVS